MNSLIQDENIVILQGDKGSSMVIMDKSEYLQKVEDMLEEGISKVTWKKDGCVYFRRSQKISRFSVQKLL